VDQTEEHNTLVANQHLGGVSTHKVWRKTVERKMTERHCNRGKVKGISLKNEALQFVIFILSILVCSCILGAEQWREGCVCEVDFKYQQCFSEIAYCTFKGGVSNFSKLLYCVSCLFLRIFISQFWLYNMWLWLCITQFWLYKSHCDFISCNYEENMSKLWDHKVITDLLVFY